MKLIEVKNVSRVFDVGEEKIYALNEVSLSIEKSEFVVILGPSGSGKSTLLNLIGGMDKVTSGIIEVDNNNISKFNEKELEKYRRDYIGFVFQFYNLIPSLTARENVAIAAKLTKNPLDVDKIIDSVGLGKRKNLFPSSLSGGELQRLSIARALVKNPKILLCDEPTGALDSKTGVQVLDLLKKIAKENNISLVIVTHNSNLSAIADKVIRLKDGKINGIQINKSPMKISEVKW